MNWVREAISDGRSGLASTKRIVMLMAGWSLSVSTLILAVAAYNGKDVNSPLVVFGGALASLAGASYVWAKHIEAKRDAMVNADNPDNSKGS